MNTNRIAEDNSEYLNRTSYKSSRDPVQRNSRERSSHWWDEYSSTNRHESTYQSGHTNQSKQQKGSK